jgi:hypothetical protein
MLKSVTKCKEITEFLFDIILCLNKILHLQGYKILLFIFEESNEHFCNITYYSFVIDVTVVTLKSISTTDYDDYYYYYDHSSLYLLADATTYFTMTETANCRRTIQITTRT